MTTDTPPGWFVSTRPQVDTQVLKAAGGAFVLDGMPVALRVNPNLQFQRSGSFYELVVTFLAATAGLESVFNGTNYPDLFMGRQGTYAGVARAETRIDLQAVVASIRGGAISEEKAEHQLCCMLATSAWAASKLCPGIQLWTDSQVQFFRFVRNAAAHGNKWYFKGDQPKQPAQWRHLVLDRVRHGQQCFGVDLLAGDLLLLLMDIEAKLPRRGAVVTLEASMR